MANEEQNIIIAQISSTETQKPININPTNITFNNHDEINRIIHDIAVNNDVVIVPEDGFYNISLTYHVGKDSGGVAVHIDFWLRKNDVNLPGSNMDTNLKDADLHQIVSVPYIAKLKALDKITCIMALENAAVGLGIHSEVASDSIPAVHSAHLTIFKIR